MTNYCSYPLKLFKIIKIEKYFHLLPFQLPQRKHRKKNHYNSPWIVKTDETFQLVGIWSSEPKIGKKNPKQVAIEHDALTRKQCSFFTFDGRRRMQPPTLKTQLKRFI